MIHENIKIDIDYEKLGIKHKGADAVFTTYIKEMYPEYQNVFERPLVIICPGGGYEHHSPREGEAVALKMLDFGYIIAGFSAGGHVAASLATMYDQPELADFLHNVLHVSPKEVRPDGLLLGYPVITSGPKAHRKSFERLLGDRYDELVKSVSLEKRVSSNTPKTFLWHTFSDGNVPVDNSLLFAESLKKAEVPFELHIFPNGNHGLGLGTKETDTKDGKHFEPEVYVWTELFKTWVEKNI